MTLMQLDLSYMTAVAAVHSHKGADFEKAAAQVTRMRFNALGRIPYLTGGKTSEDAAKEDRMAAIKEYETWKLEEQNKLTGKLVPKDSKE